MSQNELTRYMVRCFLSFVRSSFLCFFLSLFPSLCRYVFYSKSNATPVLNSLKVFYLKIVKSSSLGEICLLISSSLTSTENVQNFTIFWKTSVSLVDASLSEFMHWTFSSSPTSMCTLHCIVSIPNQIEGLRLVGSCFARHQ